MTVHNAEISSRRTSLLRLIGTLGIIGGIAMVLVGGGVWVAVSAQLQGEKITVSDDAAFLAGSPVAGPFTAFAQADVINRHALAMTDGLTYAELSQDDPARATVMNASFLRASLFTSVVSFGVAAFAIGAGLLFAAFGWAVLTLSPRPSRAEELQE